MRAYVEAYGCTLNFGEARELEDTLLARGWELAEDHEGADMSVLVTCVVVGKTERAMLKRIRALSGSPRLVVAGCMAAVSRESAVRIAPDAEFVGPGDIAAFSRLVEDVGEARARCAGAGTPYSIVPIATGCRGSCSYCLTRLARGALRSRPPERVVSHVAEAVSSGPREVQITSQDSACYGDDIGTDLPTLVHRICRLPSEFRLRIGMMNPRSVLPAVDRIADMYSEPKVFKFLHLPVQSASDRLLEAMGRGYSMADYRRMVSAVRTRSPEASFSTDIIVGYPGETDEDHAANLRFIEELAPDIVNVTRFSPRPGTRAAEAGPKVGGQVTKERSREMTRLRFGVSLARNQRWVGREVRALATERGKKRSTVLRTDEYKQIVVPGELELGTFHELVVTRATTNYLIGERRSSA